MKPLFSGPTMADPENLLIEGSVHVRDLTTVEECTQALSILEAKRISIVAQIADSEEFPDKRAPGWRSRASVALAYTKRARKAVYAKRTIIAARNKSPTVTRQAVLLDFLRYKLGSDHFDDLVAEAKVKHPELVWESEI